MNFLKAEIQRRTITILGVFIILVAISAGIYFFWQNKPEQENDFPDLLDRGLIKGSLGYPSEVIPEDIKICAVNTETGQEFCTQEHLEDEKYVYGVGYRINVLAGNYLVFAFRPEAEDFRGYYSDYVICVQSECDSHEPVVVGVGRGEIVSNINVLDWYQSPFQGISNITVETPLINSVVESPLSIKGEARGTWFFEATFPVKLLDASGNILVSHYAQAQGEWMTESFVDFEAEIEFEKPESQTGTLVLEKDNPSGLPENDQKIEIPVRFSE